MMLEPTYKLYINFCHPEQHVARNNVWILFMKLGAQTQYSQNLKVTICQNWPSQDPMNILR